MTMAEFLNSLFGDDFISKTNELASKGLTVDNMVTIFDLKEYYFSVDEFYSILSYVYQLSDKELNRGITDNDINIFLNTYL